MRWTAFLTGWTLLLAATAAPADERRFAVVVSIDGLMPDYYQRADELGLDVPNLRRLMAEGVHARVVGVLPSVTYPSHTTLITGVPPRVHGIFDNRILDPAGVSNGAWHWYARQIRATTLVGAAGARGLTSGAVSWPVSVGLGADYNLPEYWRSGSSHAHDVELLRALSTPGLVDSFERTRGRALDYPPSDADRVDVALHILSAHLPDLLLLHIFELDYSQHDHGPMGPEAFSALEAGDAELGRILGRLEELGVADRTLFAVVSDHGFLPTHTELKPNVLLRGAGLLEVDQEGTVVDWQAYFHAANGSALLFVSDEAPAGTVERVAGLLRPRLETPDGGVREILDAARIAELGGFAEVRLALDARSGFKFNGSAVGEWSQPAGGKATHGHAPDRAELHAALVLTAPGLGRRGDLGVVPMTSIAPTVARYLGLTLAPEAGEPLAIFAE